MSTTPNFITVHMIQNHVPSNLNRDDLGAPKTAYFGRTLRLRISSQCLKRSIRRSEFFRDLCGGIRSRRIQEVIFALLSNDHAAKKRAEKLLGKFEMFKSKKGKKSESDGDQAPGDANLAIMISVDALREIVNTIRSENNDEKAYDVIKKQIAENIAVPDVALCGRMLESGDELENPNVEASLQVAHAISTHEVSPEIDYYVAADDVPGQDAGAAFLDEAGFASACFYKFFNINWSQLCKNLNGNEHLAAHTVGAFIRAAALVTPTGKQNSYAHHNPPDLILIELRKTPVSYANAFARPVEPDSDRGLVGQSIAQLATYANSLDQAFVPPDKRWALATLPDYKSLLQGLAQHATVDSLEHGISALMSEMGFDWQEVQQKKLSQEQQLAQLLADFDQMKKGAA